MKIERNEGSGVHLLFINFVVGYHSLGKTEDETVQALAPVIQSEKGICIDNAKEGIRKAFRHLSQQAN